MAKPLKIVGAVASIVALIPGPWQLPAALIATATNIGSQVLAKKSAKSSVAAGSVSQMMIVPDAPRPYPMGEGHYAGVLRHRTGYGGTVDGVENPYLFDVVVYSGVGPIESITPQIDFDDVPGWYTGYLTTDTQLGEMPEAAALTASYGSPAGWGASYKLSGNAAIAWNLKFDKAGKKFASGFPLTGAYGQWAKVYDPRLDSTRAGGSGSHRVDDETTWEWSENPALHAGTYAYGRHAEGVRVMGVGLPDEGIDWAAVMAWANVCDANDWTLFGVIYEPGDRWANLKEICAAGSGEPVFAAAVLSFRYDAPVVALDTVTEADVLDDMSVTFMQSYRDRLNTVIPKYRSPDHNWEMVSADAVQSATYLAEDGEERREELTFALVKDKDQAAQLAAYKLVNSREFHPITLRGMPRLRVYRPGDCLHLDLPRLGLDTDAILTERRFDPETMTVEMTFIGETPAKHAYALGLTGTAPPAPALGQTAQERDETAAGAADRQVAIEVLQFRSFTADSGGTVTSPLPDYIVPEVTLGGQDIRDDDTVSYSIATTGVTASVNDTPADPDKGTITITDVTALNGTIDLTVTVGGVAQPAKRIAVQKTTGLPAGLGGSGAKVANDSSFNTINSTSYTALTDVMTVTLGTGETLYGSAPLDYGIADSSAVTRTATLRWRYSPAGAGTYSNFATGDIAGSTASGGFAWEPGHGDVNDSKGGLTAGDYDVKLEAKLNAGSVDVTFWGTAVIEAKV